MTTTTTPAEYGTWLASQHGSISDEQVEAAARILAAAIEEKAA